MFALTACGKTSQIEDITQIEQTITNEEIVVNSNEQQKEDLNVYFEEFNIDNKNDSQLLYSLDDSNEYYILKTNRTIEKITFSKIIDNSKINTLESFENIENDYLIIQNF